MQEDAARVSTGTPGLDDVVDGGLPPNRMYLVQGPPGSGKTTLSLGFLLEGVRHGEPVLYVTLSETGEEVQSVARAHGWSLDGVTLYEMSDTQDVRAEEDNTLFEPAEVELGPGTSGRVVVTKGLAAGDVIALRDPTRSVDQATGSGSAPASDKAAKP